jgi:hypothetical protein
MSLHDDLPDEVVLVALLVHDVLPTVARGLQVPVEEKLLDGLQLGRVQLLAHHAVCPGSEHYRSIFLDVTAGQSDDPLLEALGPDGLQHLRVL